MNPHVNLDWLDTFSSSIQREITPMIAALSADKCGLLARDGLLLRRTAETLREIIVLERFAFGCDAMGDAEGYCRVNRQIQSARRLITAIALEIRNGHTVAVNALRAEAEAEGTLIGRGGSTADKAARLAQVRGDQKTPDWGDLLDHPERNYLPALKDH